MAEKGLPAASGLRDRRDATIARLCEHFALDNIDSDKLEELIDRAHSSMTFDELDSLLAGLPSVRPQTQTSPVVLHEAEQNIVAILGGAQRSGAWVASRRVRVITFMGGAQIDFRDVALPPGRIELEVYAFMGGVEVIVPPTLPVVSDGSGIMGGFEHSTGPNRTAADREGPWLHIRGIAFMGGVEITERLPGESSGEARRRLRDEKRLLREERRQAKALKKPTS